MNTTYTNTMVQRTAVENARTDLSEACHGLTGREVWAQVVTADAAQLVLDQLRADKAAVKAVQVAKRAEVASAPSEPTAVVERTADDFIIAMDEASMVPLGLPKSDMEDLRDAASILSAWINPDGTPIRLERDLVTLGAEMWNAGLAQTPSGAQWEAQKVLERLCSGRKRQIHSEHGTLTAIPLVLGEYPERMLGESAPAQIEWIITAVGSPARERGEVVWAVRHDPIYEMWTDGSGKVGTSSWIRGRNASSVRPVEANEPKPRIGSVYPGVQRSFRSIEAATVAWNELGWALYTYRRVAELVALGDPRYTEDPVRTEGIQRDLQPRFQSGPMPVGIA